MILSKKEDINKLVSMLHIENKGGRCIYLGEYGCMWVVKPIVCEMFLCNQAKKRFLNLTIILKKSGMNLKNVKNFLPGLTDLCFLMNWKIILLKQAFFHPLCTCITARDF